MMTCPYCEVTLKALKAIAGMHVDETTDYKQLAALCIALADIAVCLADQVTCAVCKTRDAVAGVYCQPCLDNETADMSSDELF